MSGLPRRIGTSIAALSAVTLLAAGCGSSTTEGTAIAADNAGPTSTSSSSTTTTETSIEGTDEGGDIDLDVEIGECVQLGGSMEDATIDNATCGSNESNYKVIGKAPTSDQCVADADQSYYETLRGVEQGALCLDIDWVIDGCMDMPSGGDPIRIECNDPSAEDGVRVTEIVQGRGVVDDCTKSDTGFEYTERKFVVCVDDL